MDVNAVLSGARDAMSVKRVFGEAYEKDGVTVIPVAKVSGGGGGGGGPADTGGGAGFGLSARPVGVYVIRDGEVTWKPALDETRVALMGMLVPIIALLTLRSVAKAIFRKRR
ncbi:MAG: sporulation protein [Chloroflexi bacterium]|nr:sporulation protein [Chloroflexota bacterium]